MSELDVYLLALAASLVLAWIVYRRPVRDLIAPQPGPDKDAQWVQCAAPIFPQRTINGTKTSTIGKTWRRTRADGRREYRQDAETLAEQFSREN